MRKRDSIKASRPMPAGSVNDSASGDGSGSSTTQQTPAQGPDNTETSSPTVVTLTRHPPSSAPNSRNILASSSKLKTSNASSPEARAILGTFIPPVR